MINVKDEVRKINEMAFRTKLVYIQRKYGVFNEDEDVMLGLKENTPEEIKEIYKELEKIEADAAESGIDID